jgi:hypothetical protein
LKAREAIMSSPIHFDEQIDPALTYAPPWARDREAPIAQCPEPSQFDTDEPGRTLTRADPEFSGDRALLELQRQLALDPDFIPEPPSEGALALRPVLIRLCGAISVAALLAYGIASYPGMKKPVGNVPTDVAMPDLSAMPPVATDRADLVEVRAAPTALAAPPTTNPVATIDAPRAKATATADTVVVASADPIASVAVPAQTTPPSPPSRADQRPLRRIDPEELEMLVKHGNDFLSNGDLAAARLLFRRAAEGGSAEGALALGATFDPVVMHRLGAVGTAPDPSQARLWYQRAAELGSSTASQRLAGLDATH